MTTIAYKDGIIAFDGRMARSNDGTLLSDNYPKMIESDGVFFFITGSISSVQNLINTYLKKEAPNVHGAINAVVADGPDLKYIGICPDGDQYLWQEPILPNIAEAWGSGSDHALTAFDYGATAKQAVQMAAKRDLYTGGVIREFCVKTKKIMENPYERS